MTLPSQPDGDPDDRLVFRRGKLRKREDDEVKMMRDALASLADVPRVKAILLELGRFYNPVTNAAVVDLEIRRRVLVLLEEGELDGARTILQDHLTEYLKMGDPPARGPHD